MRIRTLDGLTFDAKLTLDGVPIRLIGQTVEEFETVTETRFSASVVVRRYVRIPGAVWQEVAPR